MIYSRRLTWLISGPVVQLVRTPACHAGGRGFEPHPGRQYAALAQQAEHFLGKEEVGSSNLLGSSINVPLAQLVEHLTLNQGVQGSSP